MVSSKPKVEIKKRGARCWGGDTASYNIGLYHKYDVKMCELKGKKGAFQKEKPVIEEKSPRKGELKFTSGRQPTRMIKKK